MAVSPAQSGCQVIAQFDAERVEMGDIIQLQNGHIRSGNGESHEMPGVGGQAERHGCLFDDFFACERGTTPQELLQRGVYVCLCSRNLEGDVWEVLARDESLLRREHISAHRIRPALRNPTR